MLTLDGAVPLCRDAIEEGPFPATWPDLPGSACIYLDLSGSMAQNLGGKKSTSHDEGAPTGRALPYSILRA